MKFKAKHTKSVLVPAIHATQCIKPLSRIGPYLQEYKANIRLIFFTAPKGLKASRVSDNYLTARYLIISICFYLLLQYLL